MRAWLVWAEETMKRLLSDISSSSSITSSSLAPPPNDVAFQPTHDMALSGRLGYKCPLAIGSNVTLELDDERILKHDKGATELQTCYRCTQIHGE